MGMEVDDRRERLALAETQYHASSTIYGSTDPVEILNALINFGGKPFAEAHLGLLDPETQILNVIATRDPQGIHAVQTARRLDDYPAYETLSAVEVLCIPDVATEPFLTEGERARLEARGVGAMMVIPLVVAQRLTGLVGFTNPTPVEVSTHLLRALRNLGDQIAVVFENHALLRSTATTLEEVQTLYDINRAMLSARDPLDILRVLRTYLAPDASSILHAVVVRKPESSTETIVLRHVTTATSEQTVQVPVDIDDSFAEMETTGAVFVEDIDAEKRALHDAMRAQNIRSYIAIVVREQGLTEDLVAVTYDHTQIFDSSTRRLYEAVADQIGIVLQNQRLLRSAQTNEEQLRQQVRVLQVLNRLSSGISSFESEKELLDYAAESLVTALNTDHVGIVLFEPQQDLGIVISEYPDHGAVNSKIETRNSAMINALRQAPDHPVVIQDVDSATLIEPETRDVLNKIGVVSLMIMALQSSGKIVGTVGFDLYSHESQFTPTMIETAKTMVSQIAIGLQNKRLLTDAQRRAEQLQRVATFGQSMQTALKLDTILNIMLTESGHMLPMDRMSIAFYDAHEGQLRVAGQYEDENISVDLDTGALLSMDGTFVGQVWETREMLAIADTHASTGISRTQDLSLRSVMIAPIRSRGRMLGTATVGSLRPYSYTETDQAIFQQMINQLAIAIENAEAYRQSQRVAHNEALVNDIATHFQQHSGVEDMLHIAINELGRALDARRGRIRLAMPETEAEGRR